MTIGIYRAFRPDTAVLFFSDPEVEGELDLRSLSSGFGESGRPLRTEVMMLCDRTMGTCLGLRLLILDRWETPPKGILLGWDLDSGDSERWRVLGGRMSCFGTTCESDAIGILPERTSRGSWRARI